MFEGGVTGFRCISSPMHDDATGEGTSDGMKLILSRKGFDSSAGGVPSPIFPDGRLLALPIPDASSTSRYRDIAYEGITLGDLVAPLTRGKVLPDDGAHLDPDLIDKMLPRRPDWRPLFGQIGPAQGHLRN